jgi:hypothetical protein
MRILLIQENGRHDANRKYRESFSLQRSFINLGHNCEVWGLGHSNFDSRPDFESYDWIINLENYDETGWVPSIARVKNPKKILWSVDAHCLGEGVYEQTFAKGRYDILLHSTRDFVKKDYHVWFPNCYDDSLIKPLGIEKTKTFGFCGNYVNRRAILERLQNDYGLHLDIFVIGDAMVRAINSYLCHFNLNISNDINYRSFETIGCGTLLLTNTNEQYDMLGFIDGHNCFTYRDMEELKQKMDFIQNNDMTNIAQRGLELSKKHTYDKRVEWLLLEVE